MYVDLTIEQLETLEQGLIAAMNELNLQPQTYTAAEMDDLQRLLCKITAHKNKLIKLETFK